MQRYAAVAGLPPRVIVPIPLLTPWLSTHWVGLVTPVPHGARPAAGRVAAQRGGLPRARHRASTSRTAGRADRLRRGRRAGAAAHPRRRRGDPLVVRGAPRAPSDPLPSDPDWAGGTLYVDVREHAGRRRAGRRCGGSSRASAASTAGTRSRCLGGARAGSTGSSAASACAAAAATRSTCASARRSTSGGSRRSARALLRLRAEMKLPGLAWLELSVGRGRPGRTRLPPAGGLPSRAGWPGTLYWWRRAVPRRRLRRHGPQHRPAAERGGTWGTATTETAGHR